MNTRPKLPPEVLAFDQFLNEPPEYESQRMVREFRHDAYPRWQKALDALLAQMQAAQSPAPAAPAPLRMLTEREVSDAFDDSNNSLHFAVNVQRAFAAANNLPLSAAPEDTR